ncbi:MAG: hypothetical protein AUF64_03080 [Chloroflexi bacterium 13_1_20CM_54_36]|nr:MAG: hypothetical protein AUF64_03080 [Chloroflexi bacterium 13_1_20CM_54_36]
MRQVGTVIAAHAKLEQSLFADRPVPARHGTIQPHSLRFQVVDLDDLSVQRRLELLPLLLITQCIQHKDQAVIANASHTHLLPREHLQGMHPMGRPRLHLIHPMIRILQDVGHPDRCRPAQAQSLPVAMRLEVVIQQLRHTHLVTI